VARQAQVWLVVKVPFYAENRNKEEEMSNYLEHILHHGLRKII
jgi:hypothetical protein